VDYIETFSLVARLNSIHILISVAVNRQWPIYQLNIKNAFSYGDLQGVYMDQPSGYVVSGSENLVCRLKKALYELKQSPRAWFDKFNSILFKYDFLHAMSDHLVFSRLSTGGVIVLIVYVDDIIISGSDSVGIADLKAYLNRQFHTKDLVLFNIFL